MLVSIVVSILNSISFISFYKVKLYTGKEVLSVVARYRSPKDELRLIWKKVDDVISRGNYGALERVEWVTDRGVIGDHPVNLKIIPDSHCIRQLYLMLFPKLAARVMFDECNGQCRLHTCVLLP